MRSVEHEALHLTSFCRVLTSARPSHFLQRFYELGRPINFCRMVAFNNDAPVPTADACGPTRTRTHLTYICVSMTIGISFFLLDRHEYIFLSMYICARMCLECNSDCTET